MEGGGEGLGLEKRGVRVESAGGRRRAPQHRAVGGPRAPAGRKRVGRGMRAERTREESRGHGLLMDG